MDTIKERNGIDLKEAEDIKKSWLQMQPSKNKDHGTGHTFSRKQWKKEWKQWQTLFFKVPKSLQMVTTVMKVKHACSLEEKLSPT